MNKEEYLCCYGNVRDAMKNICLSCQENERCKGCDVFGDLHKLRKIIHEHFELVELLKKLGWNGISLEDLKTIVKASQYNAKKLNELRDIKPYKFEDLKPNMWVWDKKCEMVIKIENITDNVIYPYEDYFCDPCDVSHNLRFEFEENRFYPVTKAMREVNARMCEVKEND